MLRRTGMTEFRHLVFLISLAGLAGCANDIQTASNAPVPVNRSAVVEKDAAGRFFQDPIAGFAITNVPGSAGTVQLRNREIYQVSVGSDYTAVTGEACRDVILVPTSGAAAKSSVCRVKGVWRVVSLP